MAIEKGNDPAGVFIDWVTGTDKQRERDRRDARNAEQSAIEAYEDLERDIPEIAERRFGSDPDADVRAQVVGKKIDPMLMEYYGRDPSAFEGLESEFDSIGPSAFGDLSFREGRMGQSEDYFANLAAGGPDAVADAEYQQRVSAAEQMRKANTDAALREAASRGMAGQGTLAALQNAQGSATDMYAAGLEANAMAQQRRDAAAGTVADISERRGRNALDAAATRAGGLDRYGLTTAGAQDRFAVERAGAQDDWTEADLADRYRIQGVNVDNENASRSDIEQRRRSVSDANTRARNATDFYNDVERPQQYFQNRAQVVAGQTGQWNQQAANRDAAVQNSMQQSRDEANQRDQIAQNVFTYGAASGWGQQPKKPEDEDEDAA